MPMADESKDETAESETKADAEETSEAPKEETPKEDKEEASNVDKEIDYESEKKDLVAAKERAEKALAESRYKKAEDKRDEYEEEEEKGVTVSELKDILTQERQLNQKELQFSKIRDIAQNLAGSDAERDLILEVHKSYTFPSHLSIEEQVEKSYVLANSKKIVGERNEALRALANKAETGSAGTHQDALTGSSPQPSAEDKETIKESGLIWNASKRRHEKKLGDGTFLVYDPKSKEILPQS